jgi:hypothetical protein
MWDVVKVRCRVDNNMVCQFVMTSDGLCHMVVIVFLHIWKLFYMNDMTNCCPQDGPLLFPFLCNWLWLITREFIMSCCAYFTALDTMPTRVCDSYLFIFLLCCLVPCNHNYIQEPNIRNKRFIHRASLYNWLSFTFIINDLLKMAI